MPLWATRRVECEPLFVKRISLASFEFWASRFKFRENAPTQRETCNQQCEFVVPDDETSFLNGERRMFLQQWRFAWM